MRETRNYVIEQLRISVDDRNKRVIANDFNHLGELTGTLNDVIDSPWIFGGLGAETVFLLADIVRSAAADGPTWRTLPDGSAPTQIEQVERVLGQYLYQLLFGDEKTRQCLDNALNRYEGGEISFLRIELEFSANDAIANQLSSLPWEYIRMPASEGGAFLVHKSQLVLTRRLHLSTDAKMRKLMTRGPIKVLLIAASPNRPEFEGGTRLPPVSAANVKEKLAEMQKGLPGKLQFDFLEDPLDVEMSSDYEPSATLKALNQKLEDYLPHVVHFIGHGRRRGNKGELALTGLDGRPHWVDESIFADVLCDDRELRLVVLQACESALPSRYVAGASGVASHIAARRIPAVVAMQYSIEAGAANVFATAFYDAVFGDNPMAIDVAVSKARKDMWLQAGGSGVQPSESLPVVYLLDYDHLVQTSLAPIQGQVTTPPACPRCSSSISGDDRRCSECSLLFICPVCEKRWNPLGKVCNKCTGMEPTYLRQPPWHSVEVNGTAAPPGEVVGTSAFDA